MKLTPLDIHHKEFRRALRGYSEEEVDDFLDEVAKEFERLYKENNEFKDKAESSQVESEDYQDVGATIQKALVTAQRAADEVQRKAAQDSKLMIREAEAKAKAIVDGIVSEKERLEAEVRELRQAERDFRDKFRGLLGNYQAMLDRVAKEDRPLAGEEIDAKPTIEPPTPIEERKPRVDAGPSEEPGRDTAAGETEPGSRPAQTEPARPSGYAGPESKPSQPSTGEGSVDRGGGQPGGQDRASDAAGREAETTQEFKVRLGKPEAESDQSGRTVPQEKEEKRRPMKSVLGDDSGELPDFLKGEGDPSAPEKPVSDLFADDLGSDEDDGAGDKGEKERKDNYGGEPGQS